MLKRGKLLDKLQSNFLIKAKEALCGHFMFDVICGSLCFYLEDILELRKDECEFS